MKDKLTVRRVVSPNKVRSFEPRATRRRKEAVAIDPNAPREVLPAGPTVFVVGLKNVMCGSVMLRRGVVSKINRDAAGEIIALGFAKFVPESEVMARAGNLRKQDLERATAAKEKAVSSSATIAAGQEQKPSKPAKPIKPEKPVGSGKPAADSEAEKPKDDGGQIAPPEDDEEEWVKTGQKITPAEYIKLNPTGSHIDLARRLVSAK